MNLVKSGKPFVSPSVPDLALDAYYDAEVGDVSVKNIWIYFRDACQYLGLWDQKEDKPSRAARLIASSFIENRHFTQGEKYFPLGKRTYKTKVLTYAGFIKLINRADNLTEVAESVQEDFNLYLTQVQVHGVTGKKDVLKEVIRNRDFDLLRSVIDELEESEKARKLAEHQRDEVRATSARMVRNIIRGLEPLYGFPICKLVYRLLRDKGVYNKGCCYVLKNWGDLFCFMSVRCEDGSLDAESALCAREGKVDEVRDFIVDLLAECEINQFTSDSKLKKVA